MGYSCIKRRRRHTGNSRSHRQYSHYVALEVRRNVELHCTDDFAARGLVFEFMKFGVEQFVCFSYGYRELNPVSCRRNGFGGDTDVG